MIRYQERNSRVSLRGHWKSVSAGSLSGGTAVHARTLGSTASLTFTARSFGWVSSIGPGHGIALVYVDGKKVATVDLFAPADQSQRVVWARTWSSATARTITIRVLGTGGRPRVDIDAFVLVR